MRSIETPQACKRDSEFDAPWICSRIHSSHYCTVTVRYDPVSIAMLAPGPCPAASWRQSCFLSALLSASGSGGIHSLSCTSLLQSPVPASVVPFHWTCLTDPTQPSGIACRRRGGGTSVRKRKGRGENASLWRSGAVETSLFFFGSLLLLVVTGGNLQIDRLASRGRQQIRGKRFWLDPHTPNWHTTQSKV